MIRQRRAANTNMPHLGLNTEERIQVYSELVNRARLAQRMDGVQYGGNRDLYQALGYPRDLTVQEHFLPKYVRHDIAKAIIDRPVKAAWRGGLRIQEKGAKGVETPIQKAWDKLETEHQLQTVLRRVDKLTGIGHYGILLLGLNDSGDLSLPVTSKSNKLNYIKPLSEVSATIAEYETDIKNKRYGKPTMYNVVLGSVKGSRTSVPVHHTRIIHITEDLLEDEVLGTPRLEAVYNRLIDLEKIVGGDSEMYWRGARPGFQGKVEKDFTMTPQGEKDVQDQFDEYENNLRRFLFLEGVDIKEFKQQVSDPSKNVDVQIQMISSVTGIPKRILVGSERGELSSSQDKEEWNLWVQSRREEFMEPSIVRPVVNRFMELGILPTVEQYVILWDELFAMGPKEKAEIAQLVANAIRYYTATPAAEYILPKEMFLTRLLGLTREELAEAQKLVDALPELEPMITPGEQTAMEGDKKPVGSPMPGARQRRNPMAGTGMDTVAKKQKATI